MPGAKHHQSAATTKMLFIGTNGSGKTGALASLLKAGYNVRILDFDNGMDVLVNILNDPKSPYGPEAADRLWFETLTDPMKKSPSGKLIPNKATVWIRAIELLSHWKTPENKQLGIPAVDFGPLTSWTPKDVLVIDSLSMLAAAAMNHILAMNAKLGQQPEQSHWYQAQQLIEGLCQMLYDSSVTCNVIVNCHIAYIEEDGGTTKGYPQTIGKALSPKIGSYFNSILRAKTTGFGGNQKREIITSTDGIVELKNSAPNRVKPKYPLATGLAEYFEAVQGKGPPLSYGESAVGSDDSTSPTT